MSDKIFFLYLNFPAAAEQSFLFILLQGKFKVFTKKLASYVESSILSKQESFFYFL